MPMQVRAVSAVSVRDYTDLGQMMAYLQSNQPSTVVHDPNQNTWLPNWATSNLTLTPSIQYNGSPLSLSAQGLTITYQRREGSGNTGNLTTGESASNGVLTVSANKLSTANGGQLTYICTIQYTDPEVGVPIETQCSMTYTLIQQATELKYAYINGDGLFLYDTDRNIVGASTIQLTADISSGLSITQWQYKTSNDTWAAFPTGANNATNSASTLNVVATEQNIWLNSGKIATIKLVTNDANVYDIHQIMKVYDGARGEKNLSVVLSNENHYVPCYANGNVISFNGSATTVTVFEGGTNVTSDWDITATPGTGLTGSFDTTTLTYTPSGLTADTSYCDFTCTRRSDNTTITRRYTITKTRAGADGEDAVIYSLDTSSPTINLDVSGNYTPSTITFSAWETVGNATRTPYTGRFKIEESTDGSTFPAQAAYPPATNEASKVWTPSAGVKLIRCTLYEINSTTSILDSQTVPVVCDGENGTNGTDGINGISMGITNSSDTIPCTDTGYTAVARTYNIPFYALSGIERIPVTASIYSPNPLPTGMSVNITQGTTTSDGLIALSVASNSALGSASDLTGDITISLTCTYNGQNQTVYAKYNWSKNPKGTNGTNATILQVYASDGKQHITNSSDNVVLNVRMISGASEVTPTSIQWAKFQGNSGYVDIQGATSASLTVTPAMVDDFAFFRVTACYPDSSHPHVSYMEVDDEIDPYWAKTYATVEEFKNSQGYGAIYTRVFQNKDEVDPIKSTTFSNTPPSAPQTNDYYYHLDPTNKTCILKKYNGTAWVDAATADHGQDATEADNDEFTYNYYRRDSIGELLDTVTPYAETRCFYVDPSIIDGNMQFICEVS